MARLSWLTIIGIGEDGRDGLSRASQDALENAEVVMAPPRHLALVPDLTCERVEWPVPYADGFELLLTLRGRRVVVLASGDPFWFGAGSAIARHLERAEWRAIPAVSTFAMAASALGWSLEHTTCLGLHAAPLTRLRPHLAQSQRLIVLLRDGESVRTLGAYLTEVGFAQSEVTVLEALGGPNARITTLSADALASGTFAHPVCVGIDARGQGLPLASGLPDHLFDHDGQITKRPVRALTLSALAPRPGEHLWDIGGGSGSVAIEWLLCHASTTATAIEQSPARATRIEENAERLGVDRLDVVVGSAPHVLADLRLPDVVFVGGGLSQALLDYLTDTLAPGTRLVVNAVTLEAEALLATWQASHGGTLMRIEIANAQPLGTRRGWKASYPIVQWSVTL